MAGQDRLVHRPGRRHWRHGCGYLVDHDGSTQRLRDGNLRASGRLDRLRRHISRPLVYAAQGSRTKRFAGWRPGGVAWQFERWWQAAIRELIRSV